ncbi:DUF6458 family protein [Demequina pelophila]|uniref:DUF6458 family protein n=1 Tax=Demequina pelophila TaxID=1638984 RepID=UPI000AC25CDD|nr:DUF6458 family protein [Demequina pelophila]
MAIGSGIFLIVIGAIASFAINDSIEAFDLGLIGFICMGAGVLAIIVSLIANAQRSNTSHRVINEQPAQGQQPQGGQAQGQGGSQGGQSQGNAGQGGQPSA